MDNLWASLPTRQDLKQGFAETLGAPVDGLGWTLHEMGLPIPGNEAPSEWSPSLQGRQLGFPAPASTPVTCFSLGSAVTGA
jgi:hypothetical protein